MKRQFRAIPGAGIVASTNSKKAYVKANRDFSKLDDLIDGMCYACYDNGEYTRDNVLDHVEMYLEDMDDDEEYIEFYDAVGTKELRDYVYNFCKNANY